MISRLRYTKIALLVFGLGLLAALVVVAGEYSAWERVASAMMALGIVLIPLGLFADGRGMTLLRWLGARLSRRPPARPRSKPRAAPRRRQAAARAAGHPATRKRPPKRTR